MESEDTYLSKLNRLRSSAWANYVIDIHGNRSKRATAIAIGMIDSIDTFQKISRGVRPADHHLYHCPEAKGIYLNGPIDIELWAAFDGNYPTFTPDNGRNAKFVDYSYDDKYLDEYQNALQLGVEIEEISRYLTYSNLYDLSMTIADTSNFLLAYRWWERINQHWGRQHRALEAAIINASSALLLFQIDPSKICEVLHEIYQPEIEHMFEFMMTTARGPFRGVAPSFDIGWVASPSLWYK
ncbi:hypothetical protein FE236_02115 [Mariprofundus erugo]|uniref:hypothetical protein n=1 Tax=Mariprofundus erugo TaxID=2528639 RepID=UPI0010FDC1A8|nr:hypothetical protein [Mariprofundus erugo]TLS77917.1 hypothetical protein FE236_02115 [Mariprofundus erugo]